MKRRNIIIGWLIAATFLAFWFFRPAPRYDIQQVDPRLRSLLRPYQSIKTSYYMDGGSVGIVIVDREGRTEQFALPAHLGDPNPYSKVFIGAMHDRKPGAVEIVNPEHTKRMLVCILQDCSNRTVGDDLSLMVLRRRPVDYARCLMHKIRGDFPK